MVFKWRKGEHEEFFKKINAVNRKIKKAKKEGYQNKLPDLMNYKEELNKILSSKEYSRREFNNQIKMMDIFLEKDSLEISKSKRGAIAPKWELKQIDKVILPDINKTNRELKKKITSATGIEENEKLNPNAIRKREFKFDNKSQGDFDMFIKTFNQFNKNIKDIEKKQVEGYYKAIENELTPKDSEKIKKILDKLPQEVISGHAFYNKRTEFRFVYSRDDYEKNFKTLENEWNKIVEKYEKEEKRKKRANKKKNKK